MRNIFDQYSQPENRVTHALASVLAQDRKLLRQFVRWAIGGSVPHAAQLEIVEQRLPGGPELSEEEAERRGLPDIWIHDSENWSLLIECKISARLGSGQLRRHYRTAVRRGFQDIHLLVIDVAPPKHKLPEWANFRSWSNIYQWLWKKKSDSQWAAHATSYFEIAEARLSEDGYLKDGTLTVFSGVPFGKDEPYTYTEAKRLIRLLTDELRTRSRLERLVGMNATGAGRGAITGRGGNAVWDFIPLLGLPDGDAFTRYPHLTVSIERADMKAVITIPNGVRAAVRRDLLGDGIDEFSSLLETVHWRLVKSLRQARGAAPSVIVAQRRYPSQRSQAIIDSFLQYDLRTAFPDKRRRTPVKPQPQWLEATYEALANKKSNLQVAIGAVFPYRHCPGTRKATIVDAIEETWIACKPLLDRIQG